METSNILDNGLVVIDSHKKLLLSCSSTTFTVKEPASGRLKLECSLEQILWAEVHEPNSLHISLLHRKKSGLMLWTKELPFDPTLHENAVKWTEMLMNAAYKGSQLSRRLKVMINPRGGSGKALSIWEKKVKPIFEAARCSIDVLVTEYHRHCYEHTKKISLDYDVIVLLSGDGLVHEVFNAFADREDASEAFSIPVVQIPTGSANGLSLCLLGLKDGFDVSAAALNVLRGQRMKLDLCLVQQGGRRSVSFMTQAIGMMADIDLGTENLRWLGDTRFMIGLLREVGANRQCPIKLEIKVAARDKDKIVQTYRASRARWAVEKSEGDLTTGESAAITQPSTMLHAQEQPLSPEENAEDGEHWITIDKPLSYVYAGKLPYVTRDFMQFPVALCDDGFIDIVAQERVSRTLMLKSISRAADGKLYWEPTQHYFKAKAYRLTPYAKDGYLSIDGEKYPYTPFQVEVLPRMCTTLGHGAWHAEF